MNAKKEAEWQKKNQEVLDIIAAEAVRSGEARARGGDVLDRVRALVAQKDAIDIELDKLMMPIYIDFVSRFNALPVNNYKTDWMIMKVELETWPSTVYTTEARTIMFRRYRDVFGNYPEL